MVSVLDQPHISRHVLYTLKLYRHLLHHLGFIRLRYSDRHSQFQLRAKSATIAHIVGVFFLPWTLIILANAWTEVLLFSDRLPLILAVSVLVSNLNLHLFRRRKSMQRRVKILNDFCQVVEQIHRITGRPIKLSWFIALQVALKFVTVGLFVMHNSLMYIIANPKHGTEVKVLCAYYELALVFSVWSKDIPNHVLVIALKTLEKSYAQLNLELEVSSVTLRRCICMFDRRAMQTANEKICQLRQLYTQLKNLSLEFTRHTEPHFLLALLYDVLLLLAVVFNGKQDLFAKRRQQTVWWELLPTVGVCLNNLRFLCSTFEEIARQVDACGSRHFGELFCNADLGCGLPLILAQMTMWQHTAAAAAQLDSEKLYLRHKDFFLSLLVKPEFTFFGLVRLDRRLFFKMLLVYCSFLYIYYMCGSIIAKSKASRL